MASTTKNSSNKKRITKKGSSSGGKRSREEWHGHVLAVLKQQKSLGHSPMAISKLKTLCQYPGAELSFKNNILSKLKTQKGAVEYPESGHVCITDNGDAMVPDDGVADLATNEDVQEHLKETLLTRASHKEVFDFLVLKGTPQSWSNIAAACSGKYDPNSLSFRNNIMSKLKAADVIEYINEASAKNKNYSERVVQLTDMCYPHSRP